MRPAWWRIACLALLFGVLAQGTAWAQKPAPADTRELVAVLELEGVNASKPQLAAATEELRAQLLHSGKFRVVDRQQVDALLKEQAFQQTGCTSQECAVQVGKLLGVRKIVTGRITRIDETLWQAAAQMVDVESGETLRAETVTQRGAFEALLGEGLAALTGKLTGAKMAQARSSESEPVAASVPSAEEEWPGTPVEQQPNPEDLVPVERDPITGMEFVWIPGGTFEMGCGEWDRDCDDQEKPPHQVTVSGFWLGETEVTVGAFQRFVTQASYVTEAERWRGCYGYFGLKWGQQADKSWKNPGFSQGDNHPVACVSWNDAVAFAEWMSRQSGQRIRLPREAEWEYACRAAGKEQVYGTQSGRLSSDAANYSDSRKNATTPVASYPPNGLGLYDMSGNVWEWVQDAYQTYSGGIATDPMVDSGTDRVIRGGGWFSYTRYARCSGRYDYAPSGGNYNLGFRLARSP